MHTDEHTLHSRCHAPHSRFALINVGCRLVNSGRRRKRIQDLVLSIFNQCNSVLLRGKMVYRFSCHFEKNLICKLLTPDFSLITDTLTAAAPAGARSTSAAGTLTRTAAAAGALAGTTAASAARRHSVREAEDKTLSAFVADEPELRTAHRLGGHGIHEGLRAFLFDHDVPVARFIVYHDLVLRTAAPAPGRRHAQG